MVMTFATNTEGLHPAGSGLTSDLKNWPMVAQNGGFRSGTLLRSSFHLYRMLKSPPIWEERPGAFCSQNAHDEWGERTLSSGL
jgi:hypothetical protein